MRERQIEAVPLPAFARFMQRWQHLTPDTRAQPALTERPRRCRSLYGLSRPASAWERDYLPARVTPYEPASLSALAASGALAWAAVPPKRQAQGEVAVTGAPAAAVSGIRFFERGTGRLWLSTPDEGALGEAARAVLDALRRLALPSPATWPRRRRWVRSACAMPCANSLRAGLVTNDTIDALRDVISHRPVFPRQARRRT